MRCSTRRRHQAYRLVPGKSNNSLVIPVHWRLPTHRCLSLIHHFAPSKEKGKEMSKVQPQTIEDLIKQLGGRQNIATLTHCITRLRLVLKHPEQANIDHIKTFSMVRGCFTHGDQCQIVMCRAIFEAKTCDKWRAT
ncbi:MAG: hypothetical protein EKE20_08555, partial [Candidatus Symbiopectobacterium sp. Dall1.0]|nr:hypothetical protein [Candidatus Symbiopectobacterium sp. Dall1.0]